MVPKTPPACAGVGETLEMTKVVMDKGTAESPEAARKLTAPITPGPEGTSTGPPLFLNLRRFLRLDIQQAVLDPQLCQGPGHRGQRDDLLRIPGRRQAVRFRLHISRVSPATILASRLFPASVITNP